MMLMIKIISQPLNYDLGYKQSRRVISISILKGHISLIEQLPPYSQSCEAESFLEINVILGPANVHMC